MQSRKQVQETVEREAAKPVGLYPLQTSRVLPPSAAGKGAPEDGESSVSPICAAMIYSPTSHGDFLFTLSPPRRIFAAQISLVLLLLSRFPTTHQSRSLPTLQV
jgi:hypothetical protein